ncbi:MAG: SBBP repeat-containing protein, partial [Bryobacteraceae bacterium]
RRGQPLVGLRLDRARPSRPEAELPLAGKTNYLVGADPGRWRTDVANYGRVRMREVYPGIDAVFYGRDDSLEYDLVVSPGAEPRAIRLRFERARALRIDSNGDLLIQNREGELRHRRPLAYQEIGGVRKAVEARYKLLPADGVEVALGPYDRRRQLVIDPVLTYFHTMGGSEGRRVALDREGNVYVAGNAYSGDLPVTPGAVGPTYSANLCARGLSPGAPCLDVFVAKWDPTGTRLLWATYLGGRGDDSLSGLAVDAEGNAYLTGFTSSPDLPVTPGAAQTRYAGTQGAVYLSTGDAFVAKLNPQGGALVYSTYLGGRDEDSASEIAIDAGGNAYVTGTTSSSDFPTTPGAWRRALASSTAIRQTDVFVTKLNPDGSGFLFSTYLGGSRNDAGMAITVDSGGQVAVAGNTMSPNFPTTDAASQKALRGSFDAFVARLDPSGSAILASTYLGGRGTEQVRAMAPDGTGGLLIAGVTDSLDLPVTGDALKSSIGDSICSYQLFGQPVACTDVFLARFDADSAQLRYATYFGGSGADSVGDIGVDSDGAIYLAGATSSSDFPVTVDAYQPCRRSTVQGSGDAFIAKLNLGGRIEYSTYLGGSGGAQGNGLALTEAGEVLLTGSTAPVDFPPDPVRSLRLGGGSPTGAFLGRLNLGSPAQFPRLACVANAGSLLGGPVAPGQVVILQGAGIGPDDAVRFEAGTSGYAAPQLAGVRVLFDDIAAPLVSVQSKQVIAVVPYATLGKDMVHVRVEYLGVTTNSYPVVVTSLSPAVFSSDGTGRGQAAVVNEDGSVNSPGNPARKGSVVAIYATGLGPVNSPPEDGAINRDGFPQPEGRVLVSIGGYSAEVPFAGGAPGQVFGVFQVNARVPMQPASGEALPVIVGVELPSLLAVSPTQSTIAVK